MCIPSIVSKISALYHVLVLLDLECNGHDLKSNFLSRHRLKFDIVTVNFKVIQGQRSWCEIKESAQVHI